MSKQRIAVHVIGVLVLLAAVVYIARPSPHVPLYDANLVRLAETERQGYCAGVTFWRTAGEGNAGQAKACRQANRGTEGGAVDLFKTARGFCRGIVYEGWDGGVQDCLFILETQQLWPTFDGSITDQWNRARPYPQPAIGSGKVQEDESRTGGRPGNTGHPGYDRGGYAP